MNIIAKKKLHVHYNWYLILTYSTNMDIYKPITQFLSVSLALQGPLVRFAYTVGTQDSGVCLGTKRSSNNNRQRKIYLRTPRRRSRHWPRPPVRPVSSSSAPPFLPRHCSSSSLPQEPSSLSHTARNTPTEKTMNTERQTIGLIVLYVSY